ncbi:beta-ketoacyl-[acyl-carrier-protein] synthase family protein [Kitasatospora sp. P5_F3]
MREVVVTGLGVVSPMGHDVPTFWRALLAGQDGAEFVEYPELGGRSAPSYPVAGHPVQPGDERLGRASQFALAAAGAALADAALPEAGETSAPIGLYLGLGTGDGDVVEAGRSGRRELSGMDWWPYGSGALLAGRLGLYGPNLTVATACSAGAYAVGLAAEAIAAGEAEVMLVGGSEGVSRPAMGAFLRLGAVDPHACRPFDADRQGTVYGEGAAFLVLESAESAAARGRTPYARVLGSGWSCDAYHPTAPEPTGAQAVRAAREALERGGRTVGRIGALICHGTGTPMNDRTESLTMGQLLAERASEVPATAIKAALGHSGGAAGAFSCLVGALVVHEGLVPPTANLNRLDPDCPLALVTGSPAAVDGDVLVNAYAFGGNNISVLLGAAS